MTTVRTLQRSAEDRLICGVSGGLAERFDLDPVAVRIGWLVACLLTAGGAAILYIGLCFALPLGGSAQPLWVQSDPKIRRQSPEQREFAGGGAYPP
jgi:phage shock protein C